MYEMMMKAPMPLRLRGRKRDRTRKKKIMGLLGEDLQARNCPAKSVWEADGLHDVKFVTSSRGLPPFSFQLAP